MTRIGVAFLGPVLALGTTLASNGMARSAEPCSAVCGVQRRMCVQTARVTKLACTETCRATSGPAVLGACMRGCSSAFRTAKTTCRFEHRGCFDGCTTPAGAPRCVGSCGRDLAACVQDVTGTGRACLSSCESAADRRACVGACTAALRAGTASCRSELRTCKAACRSDSPSGAFAAE
jgi:hypothetical protein